MKIQILTTTVVEVVTEFDENDEILEQEPELMIEGSVYIVDILEEDDEQILVQFPSGGVAEIPKTVYGFVNEPTPAEEAANVVVASPEMLADATQNTEALAQPVQTQHQQPEQ